MHGLGPRGGYLPLRKSHNMEGVDWADLDVPMSLQKAAQQRASRAPWMRGQYGTQKSLVFMPKMLDTALRGRKMTVTMLNAYTAFSCLFFGRVCHVATLDS